MGLRWVPRKTREPQERSAAASGPGSEEVTGARRSPYSKQFETLIVQGHERPTPSFGAPTLVWHVAMWPRRYVDGSRERGDPHDTAGEKHLNAKRHFEKRRASWVKHIEGLLESLRSKGCHPEHGPPLGSAKGLQLVRPHDLSWSPTRDDPDDFFKPIDILEQNAAPFTLWWPDSKETDEAAGRANAIRVCVHPEINADYASIAFYMDVGRRWNDDVEFRSVDAAGKRRRELLAAVEDIRTICENQIEPVLSNGSAAVDMPSVPENLYCPDGRTAEQLHESLNRARNLLYVDVWEEFAAEVGCRIENIAGTRGDVFANIRGLVMSTNGLQGERPVYQPQGLATASVGTAEFANFSRDQSFNADGAEANAVVKAFWPFMRRVTPRADFREFIACGVLNWRAIFITALGSGSQYVGRQERKVTLTEEGEASIRVPPQFLSAEEKPFARPSDAGHFDSLVRPREGRTGNNHPVRYLLLTKREPHPNQIGRIADRINTMGTMRLYALKDWAAIRNADAYIRILGQELDQITKRWGRDRRLIGELTSLRAVRHAKDEIRRLQRELEKAGAKVASEEEKVASRFAARSESLTWSGLDMLRLRKVLPTYTPRKPANLAIRFLLRLRFFYSWSRYRELLKGMENDLIADIRHSALYEISNEVETALIDISSKLDELGFGAIGGMHFRLNRAAYHVREFKILLKTLQVGNIPTWTSYEQFVRRGLAPAFDFMASVGKRLRAVRTRLLAVTETIETSALVGQSAATRHNTAVLRQMTTLAIVVLLLYVTSGQVWRAATKAFSFLYGKLPPELIARLDEFLAAVQSVFQ